MSRSNIKILMADDDPEDLELMEEQIRSVAPIAELEKFMDGVAAYEYLRSLEDKDLPGLIVLDYNMPGLNGCQVLLYLKGKRYSSIPKIILSSSNTEKYIAECMNNGAAEYIVKPASMREIHDLAKRLVSLAMESR